MKKILSGPWTRQELEKPTLSHLNEEHYQALTLPIVEARRELQRVGDPFTSSRNILPIHCKNALSTLGELKENVSVASHSLSYPDSFVTTLSPSRYPLLTILYTIEEQTLQLINLLDTYRFSCLEPSRHVRRQQCEIVSQLEDISQQLADISELAKSLDEDVESKERYLSVSDLNADQTSSETSLLEHASRSKSSSTHRNTFHRRRYIASNKIVPIRKRGNTSGTEPQKM